MFDIVCAHPDHAANKGRDGWAESLGTASVPQPDTYCGACGRVATPAPEPAMDPLALLSAMDPAQLGAVLAAAEGFVTRAGDLWDAFVNVPPSDPAHDAIGIVTDIALTAALPLVEEP